jgi:Endosomal/lysosomal potassium channel TMEM175
VPLTGVFLSCALSFLYVGIHWNNHHHMLHACEKVTGGILWANLRLLFWLSLIPFATVWLGENRSAAAPSALYGMVLLLAAIAWMISQQQIIGSQPKESVLKKAAGKDWKGGSFTDALSRCDCDGFSIDVDFAGVIRVRGPDLAGSRSQNREGDRGPGPFGRYEIIGRPDGWHARSQQSSSPLRTRTGGSP